MRRDAPRNAKIGRFPPTLLIAASLTLAWPAASPAEAFGLPEGEGRLLVETHCANCHSTGRISSSSGYTTDGWRELIATMVDFSGDPEEANGIVRYLADHFPPNDRLAPRLVKGPVEIVFREWVVPTPGQRSRDPIEAADGTIWWAGQWGNIVGRIDPTTGSMKEYQLPAGAKPHSVTLDAEGDVWYTGNKNATIGRLDAKTGRITEFRMPDPAARDPHTAIFDRRGILWFTLQHSNMIGRLVPETGKVDLITLPSPGSRPYGIKIDAKGVPWVACNGGPCLIKVDPATMKLTEVDLPTPGTTVRRLDIAPNGMIWYVNSGQGRLGRFDPRSGKICEWPSPSGPDSHPYALVIVDGIVWYNESRKRPDALVRFVSTTALYDRANAQVAFAGVSDNKFSRSSVPIARPAASVSAALEAAVGMAYRSWNARVWKELMSRGN